MSTFADKAAYVVLVILTFCLLVYAHRHIGG